LSFNGNKTGRNYVQQYSIYNAANNEKFMKSTAKFLSLSILSAGLAFTHVELANASPSFINALTVPGGATDLSGLSTPFERRLSIGSDLVYDRATNSYFGLADRGPGGGVLAYETRLQQFGLSVNSTTGAISNFSVMNTVLFKDANGTPLSGLNPQILNGTSSRLGNSFDPEGLVRMANGNFFIADEYGPAIREFNAVGQQLRVFTTPSNLIPSTAAGVTNYVDGRPTITSGRQDNRGFEGLTLSADGTKLVAVMQAPLVNEGANNDGRRSQNVRIVEFDIASGNAGRQLVYQTESIASINSRLPAGTTFSATQQGRSIGLSAIYALPDGRYLVLERDNRGLGVEDITAATPVGSKRVYLVDPRGATDVSNISLAGLSNLPAGVVAVNKLLYLDINEALKAAGVAVAEKIEGLSFGPQLSDGSFVMLLVSDNDFSVTQNATGQQFNVCYDTNGGSLGSTTVGLDQNCGLGTSLIPSFIYAFKVNDLNPVPLPATAALIGLGLISMRRARKVA
jgi:hypothetical protein